MAADTFKRFQTNISLGDKGVNNATGRMPGQVSAGQGDRTNSLQSLSRQAEGSLGVGGSIAGRLNQSGMSTQSVSGIMTNTVAPSLAGKSGLSSRGGQQGGSRPAPAPGAQRKRPTTKIANSKNEVSGTSSGGGLMFPPDLSENTPAYIWLQFKKYNRSDPFSAGSQSTSGSIYLPLPDNFNQTFNMRIDARDLGGYEDLAGSSIYSTAAQNYKAHASKGDNGTLEDFSGTMNEAAKIAIAGLRRFGRRSLATVDENLGGMVDQQFGNIPNPHASVFFQGMNLRQFAFTWKFVPRSADEASVIQDVIKKVKKHALPKKDGKMLLYPDMVKPKVVGNDNLGEFKTAMISSLDINYAAEGTSAFFHDGHPVAIQLTMQLQETEIFTEDNMDK